MQDVVQTQNYIQRLRNNDPTLTKLDLSDQADDEILKQLAESLESNIHLTDLNLSNNSFSSSAIAWLAQALTINNSLLALDLSYTDMEGEEGVHYLDSTIMNNPNILLAGYCDMSKDAYDTLEARTNEVRDLMIGYKNGTAEIESLKQFKAKILFIANEDIECNTSERPMMSKEDIITFTDYVNSSPKSHSIAK